MKRPLLCIFLLFAVPAICPGGGHIEYPAEGNFDPDRGTIELWFSAGRDIMETFEPRDTSQGVISFFRMAVPDSHHISVAGTVRANASEPYIHASLGSQTDEGGMLPIPGPHGSAAFIKGDMHHLAFTWDGVYHALYLDGELLGQRQQKATFGEPGPDDVITIGHHFMKDNPIIVHAFRISSRELDQGELQHSEPVATDDTLLLDRFEHVVGGATRNTAFSELEVNSSTMGTQGTIRGGHSIVEEPAAGVALFR